MMIKFIFLFVLFCSISGFAQEIQPGLSTAQLISLKGQPYYQTEHYANRPGEQVWLYTKKRAEKTVDEKQITDPQTKWFPTLYRKTITRTCEIGDVFVEISKGVVKNTIPANTALAYGPCTITTLEEFLPMTNGKVTEAAARKIENTVLEQAARK